MFLNGDPLYKPFYFTINPQAFLSDSLVDQMTPLELGACFRLLCRQWIDGDLPDDIEQLRRLSRLTKEEIENAWEVINKFFPIISKGKRANRYADDKRKDIQDSLTKRHEAGVKAAEKRWGANGNRIPIAHQSHSIGNTIDIDIVKDIVIDKVIVKKKTTNMYKPDAAFNHLWDNYPKDKFGKSRRGEKAKAYLKYKEIVDTGQATPAELIGVVDLYKSYPKVREGYIKMVATLFAANDGLWIELLEQYRNQAVKPSTTQEAIETSVFMAKLKSSAIGG